jgi:hypothetical protein
MLYNLIGNDKFLHIFERQLDVKEKYKAGRNLNSLYLICSELESVIFLRHILASVILITVVLLAEVVQ